MVVCGCGATISQVAKAKGCGQGCHSQESAVIAFWATTPRPPYVFTRGEVPAWVGGCQDGGPPPPRFLYPKPGPTACLPVGPVCSDLKVVPAAVLGVDVP